ncbi:coagulation factor IIIa [Heptranchias perlo]|uniref:coagulation factor IIIa n=1 Tax=Heptranchias perlo TaxID=212740 RepID=UPI00355979C6
MGCGADFAITLGFAIICLNCGLGSGTSLEPVTNVTWKSFNFRTTLQWAATSEDSVYTVRVSGEQSNWKKKPECTRSKITSCDLTNLIQNVADTYTAEVLTYSATKTEDVEEPPLKRSTAFQPLKQTDIGQATFELIEKNKTEVQLTIKDPLTFIKFSNNTFKTIRDIYGSNLEYIVFYWKDRSSGKKSLIAKDQDKRIKVEEGVTYCFSIQPHIKSPFKDGQESSVKCTRSQRDSPSDYGIGVYVLIIIGALLVIGIIIGVTVYLCRRKAVHNSAEMNPLKMVSA